MKISHAGLLALIYVSVVPNLASAQEKRPVEVEDMFDIASVGSPVMSPDGEWVAYTVGTTNLEEETTETRLWMVPADPNAPDSEPVPMTRAGESVSNPKWSPDGRYLSFVATRGDGAKSQVWVLDRRGGEARALTSVSQGVSDYVWSPDGTSLALTIRDPAPTDSTRKTNAPQDPWVIDRLQFKRDGSGYLTGDQHTHLYRFDLATDSLVQLTAGVHDESSPAWSPDGGRIAFVSNRTDDPDTNENSDLWIVRSDAPEPVTNPTRVTTNAGSDRSPAWSPDGSLLTYVTGIRPDLIWYATSHLAVINPDGSDSQVLTEDLDRNVSSPRFSADGSAIYFRLEDSGENHLARIDINGDLLTRPVVGQLSMGSFDLGPADQIIALVGRLDHPPEIFRQTVAGLRPLTHVHDTFLDKLQLGEVRNETFLSEDGTEIEGFFTLPPDYVEGNRYPTLLRIHGGPVSQFSASFNFEAQLFAANGYVVVQTNPRGSSGYGQEFSRALWANWGTVDFEDVNAGVDHAISQGWADPERLGVGGWSYGGILTNYVITQSDRFEGAITGASEVLYIANYGHDHYQRQWEAELGLPWEGDNRDTWERISPFNKAHLVTTPTLIMGGEDDWNVPIQNSEQLYQVIRRQGVPTQLVVYPGQSHGLRPPSYQKDRMERYLAWYARWVKQRGATTLSPPPLP